MQLVYEMKEKQGWSKSTTSTMLRRMQEKGYIRYEEGQKARLACLVFHIPVQGFCCLFPIALYSWCWWDWRRPCPGNAIWQVDTISTDCLDHRHVIFHIAVWLAKSLFLQLSTAYQAKMGRLPGWTKNIESFALIHTSGLYQLVIRQMILTNPQTWSLWR